MKKRIVALFTGIILLLVTSISVSFAWFSGARELYIDFDDFVVETDADIFLSMDENFDNATHSLTKDDFGELEPFEPVSSMYAEHSEWYIKPSAGAQGPIFAGQYNGSADQQNPKSSNAAKGFFSKKMYLFSNRNMYVTIDAANTVVKPQQELNEALAQKKAEENPGTQSVDEAKEKYLAELNSIENSLRISILDYENEGDNAFTIIDPKKNGTTVFGGRLNTSVKNTYYDYYTDNEGAMKEIVYGDIKSQDHEIKYLPKQDSDIEVSGTPTCFNAGTKAGVCPLDIDDLASNVEFYEEQSITLAQAEVGASDEPHGYMVKLDAYVAHPIILSVYIEGWDLDNTDCTQQGSFEMNIKFKLCKEASY